MTIGISDILAICAAIITVSGAITVISGWIVKAKAPNEKQNERIQNLETRLDAVEDRLVRGDRRFNRQDSDIKIVMESLSAMMKHMINGNDVDALKDTQHKLETHLISTHTEQGE